MKEMMNQSFHYRRQISAFRDKLLHPENWVRADVNQNFYYTQKY